MDFIDVERSRMVGRLRKFTEQDKLFLTKLKENHTKAEEKLWGLLQNRQFLNLKFRRQHKIGRFVVDFFCIKHLLAIEVDGLVHACRVLEDAARTRWLESLGVRVIRFHNGTVLNNPDFVLNEIR